MTSVRGGGLVLAILWLVGCGAVEADQASQPSRAAISPSDARPIAGLGIAADLPAGWTARILVGAEGRPVLHAASFPLPANDDDSGSVAQQIIASAGMAYVNVRDLGPGPSESASRSSTASARSSFVISWSRVPQHHQLDVLHTRAATAANKQTEQSSDSEVEEGEEHAADPPSPRQRKTRPK